MTLSLRIDSLAFGGDGVGRAPDGRVVFVPGTCPGDTVEVALAEERSGYARARLARIAAASCDRVAPPCPIFVTSECGGCQWQHVSAAAQLRAKEDIVRRALRRVVDASAVEPILSPTPPLRWRRRARMKWLGSGGCAPARVGYLARRSHRLVDVTSCPQLEAAIETALAKLRQRLGSRLAGRGELMLLAGGRGDVHVEARGDGATALAPEASELLGADGIAGMVLAAASGPAVSAGVTEIDLADDDAPFLSSAGGFAQASGEGNRVLRGLVMRAAGDLTGARVLELHAGNGNFTRDLARDAAALVAVEDSGRAVDLATRNLELRGLSSRVSLRRDTAEAALAALGDAGERFDVVVLDPPRTGLLPPAARLLAALAPARIVYVSCDPNTLARDLGLLESAGSYRVQSARPADLMPQTYHVETVVTAARVP